MQKVSSKSKNIRWVVSILFLSFFISIAMSLLSNGIMKATNNVIVASFVVFAILLINIFFDVIGVAVTAAQEEPMYSMASRKMLGSKIALKLIKNADRVSNVCNDVVGDICGIISGAGGAYIIVSFNTTSDPFVFTLISLCITGIIASATVAGKSMGKTFAIKYCNDITFLTGKVLAVISREKHEKVNKKDKLRRRLRR